MDNKLSHQMKAFSWEALSSADRTTVTPFQLMLVDSEHPLVCQEIIRIMPGKRLVAFGTWGNKSVVAKLFFEKRRAIKHAKRDASGIKSLLQSGILTPTLHYQGSTLDKRVQVLLFERINHALSLEDIWRLKTNLNEVMPLMRALTVELATQHVLGVTQHDLHFKNFLIRKKSIYTLDGDDISLADKPLSKKESVANLGVFFAQMGVGTEDLQTKLFNLYTKSRGWIVKKHDIQGLKLALKQASQKRWENYREKILRNCTAFVRKQTATQLTIYDRSYESPALLQALKQPDVLLAAQATDILKNGRSSTVAEVEIDQRPYVMKRYNMKNFMHRVRRCLRPTRAAKNWELAHLLRLVGIPSVKPIAIVEKHMMGLRGKSFLLMEYIDGVHAGEFFTDVNVEPSIALGVAKDIVTLLENLAKLRITHGDLKMTNILIAKQKPILIDLDGMQEHRWQWRFQRDFNQEIQRFMANWKPYPSVYKMFELLIADMYSRMGMTP